MRHVQRRADLAERGGCPGGVVPGQRTSHALLDGVEEGEATSRVVGEGRGGGGGGGEGRGRGDGTEGGTERCAEMGTAERGEHGCDVLQVGGEAGKCKVLLVE